MILFCIQVAAYQVEQGRKFIIENPQGSAIWNLSQMLKLAQMAGVSWDILHMCAYGALNPKTGELSYKPTCLMHSLDEDIMRPVFKKCSKDHSHGQLSGQACADAQVYPKALCAKLAKACLQSCTQQARTSKSIFQADEDHHFCHRLILSA